MPCGNIRPRSFTYPNDGSDDETNANAGCDGKRWTKAECAVRGKADDETNANAGCDGKR